jgi:hypothetical protein
MDLKDSLGVAGFVISLINFAVTMRLTRSRDTLAVKPMLVFTYTNDGWHIENLGNGPALDVIFTRFAEETSAGRHVRLPTLAKGARLLLHFARDDNSLTFVATYVDITNRKYTSRSRHDVSSIVDGWHGVDRPDSPGEVERWWELPDSRNSDRT